MSSSSTGNPSLGCGITDARSSSPFSCAPTGEELLEVFHPPSSASAHITSSNFSSRRSLVHKTGLWHRTSLVLVAQKKNRESSNGEGSDYWIILQRRSAEKDTNPGRWDLSVAGHLDPSELPLEGAWREVKEELAATLTPLPGGEGSSTDEETMLKTLRLEPLVDDEAHVDATSLTATHPHLPPDDERYNLPPPPALPITSAQKIELTLGSPKSHPDPAAFSVPATFFFAFTGGTRSTGSTPKLGEFVCAEYQSVFLLLLDTPPVKNTGGGVTLDEMTDGIIDVGKDMQVSMTPTLPSISPQSLAPDREEVAELGVLSWTDLKKALLRGDQSIVPRSADFVSLLQKALNAISI